MSEVVTIETSLFLVENPKKFKEDYNSNMSEIILLQESIEGFWFMGMGQHEVKNEDLIYTFIQKHLKKETSAQVTITFVNTGVCMEEVVYCLVTDLGFKIETVTNMFNELSKTILPRRGKITRPVQDPETKLWFPEAKEFIVMSEYTAGDIDYYQVLDEKKQRLYPKADFSEKTLINLKAEDFK